MNSDTLRAGAKNGCHWVVLEAVNCGYSDACRMHCNRPRSGRSFDRIVTVFISAPSRACRPNCCEFWRRSVSSSASRSSTSASLAGGRAIESHWRMAPLNDCDILRDPFSCPPRFKRSAPFVLPSLLRSQPWGVGTDWAKPTSLNPGGARQREGREFGPRVWAGIGASEARACE